MGEINVALLTSKSKVAPIKKQTIPRLELCGVVIGAQLYEKVVAALQINVETFFWVDSTVVLYWLKSSPSTWTTFVANRVSTIQLATESCHWNHVAGIQNPADLISRGTTADNLVSNRLWWKGPERLARDPTEWPISQLHPDEPNEALRETKSSHISAVSATETPSFLDQYVARHSNYQRMLRITAYCHRFQTNCCLPKNQRTTDVLTTAEIDTAENTLIKLVQGQFFKDEVEKLKLGKPISPKSRLRWFNPFLDDHQVLRVGGRLTYSQLPFNSKHQAILPSSHPFSALLVESIHLRQLHASPQLLLTTLRLRYWVIGARNLVKRPTRNCITCCRNRPKTIQQYMADLPPARVTASRPFSTAGIDYWGPILVKQQPRRAAPTKAYVAVFVCFSTRAVHLELVGDLSTAKFLQALRRFVSRRGLCSDIYSDNGRNFLGASNELQRLANSKEHRDAVYQECLSNGIKWHFNPPKASHFGGLWEAAIASAQKHFFRVLGPHTLYYDDTETLLTQIECCLNSRPIVPISDDPNDYEALTPGHFLVGSSLKSVPDVDHSSTPINRLRQWQQVQKLFQHLWRRWHLEYLCCLQPRTKWVNPPTKIEVGRLVIIKDEAAAPMTWQTARIDETHPGPDGIVRVVTLRTPHGKFTRPVSKLCLLPIASSQSEMSSPSENKATEPSNN
ncbi:uncharacterized protein LOC134219449 [Armigeres subalbatus]|uniref:uncharacterized protein LOC134219449 n=1 Tax=Armigeres subalbatus TaxID=124917 RepID=UPI002ED1B9B1